MITKKKAIKKAWREFYDRLENVIDENGFVRYNHLDNSIACLEFLKMYCINGTSYFRPHELTGIEHNNGWIPLKGQKNEIDHYGDIWIINKYGNIEYRPEKMYLEIGYATHWQPVLMPKDKIYDKM